MRVLLLIPLALLLSQCVLVPQVRDNYMGKALIEGLPTPPTPTATPAYAVTPEPTLEQPASRTSAVPPPAPPAVRPPAAAANPAPVFAAPLAAPPSALVPSPAPPAPSAAAPLPDTAGLAPIVPVQPYRPAPPPPAVPGALPLDASMIGRPAGLVPTATDVPAIGAPASSVPPSADSYLVPLGGRVPATSIERDVYGNPVLN